MSEPRIYNSRWDKARLSFLKSNPHASCAFARTEQSLQRWLTM